MEREGGEGGERNESGKRVRGERKWRREKKSHYNKSKGFSTLNISTNYGKNNFQLILISFCLCIHPSHLLSNYLDIYLFVYLLTLGSRIRICSNPCMRIVLQKETKSARILNIYLSIYLLIYASINLSI